MFSLDADENPLYSDKLAKAMERDIVQFVPFRNFKDNPLELARQTLEEVPRQLLDFFESRGIRPNRANKKEVQRLLTRDKNYQEAFEAPEFFVARKIMFAQHLGRMGYPPEKVNEILEHGLPEENVELVLDMLQDPRIKNTLLWEGARQAPVQRMGYLAGAAADKNPNMQGEMEWDYEIPSFDK